jgi:hypothetical protein
MRTPSRFSSRTRTASTVTRPSSGISSPAAVGPKIRQRPARRRQLRHQLLALEIERGEEPLEGPQTVPLAMQRAFVEGEFGHGAGLLSGLAG